MNCSCRYTTSAWNLCMMCVTHFELSDGIDLLLASRNIWSLLDRPGNGGEWSLWACSWNRQPECLGIEFWHSAPWIGYLLKALLICFPMHSSGLGNKWVRYDLRKLTDQNVCFISILCRLSSILQRAVNQTDEDKKTMYTHGCMLSLRGRNLTSHGYNYCGLVVVKSKFDGKKRIFTAKTCEVVQ
jgi:hypothetical protein